MCGRYQVDFEDMSDALAVELGLAPIENWPLDGVNRRDILPSDTAPALLGTAGDIAVKPMRWGFKQESGALVINARVESLSQRAMFRGLEARQRCAMPATRYYEWRRGDRQKFQVSLLNRPAFYLAGLYRIGQAGCEFVVLTQPPVPSIQPVHNRMPLLLDSSAALFRWLSGEMPLFTDDGALSVSAEGPEQLRMPL